MSGIDGAEIKRFITNHGGEDMRKDFLGVYAADELRSLTGFRNKLSKNKHVIPFCIVNTDPIELPGQHWIALLNICPKQHIFIFDSYGELGYREFIRSDDEEILNHFFTPSDDNGGDANVDSGSDSDVSGELSYKSIRFKAKEYDAINVAVKKQLTPTCQGLMELLKEYAKSTQSKELVLHFLIDQIQERRSYWCGVFVLFFLHNLYNPIFGSKSNANNKCSMNHIKMVLNELFNAGSNNNNRRLNSISMEVFAKDYDIKGVF